jgi:serpin B
MNKKQMSIKTTTSENKKKTQLYEKLFNHPNKTVPTDKKIVPAGKKQIEANKKISTIDKKIVSINKNLITKEPKAIISTDDFQLKIFKEINKSNIGKNIMISPISIYHILSLTANGAANKTLTEMLHALSEKSIEELNKKNSTISSLFAKFKSVELANAVFTRFNPLDDFQKMIKEYKAKLDYLKDANQINLWCSDATHKKIPKIVDTITGADKMVLINAIYFNGIWQEPFDKNNTRLNAFFGSNNQIKKIMFMNSTKNFDYFEDEGLQAISLNYTKDNLNALIILPKNKSNINNYIQNFTSKKYNMIIGNLTNKKVKLSLPKFEFDFSAELSQISNL